MALTTNSDSFADTDTSDSTGNGSIGNSLRLVTLHKANVMFNGTLGFSIRGGREHTTGVFVSNVEPNSEAERSGLCIGDQIVRINGFPIEDATHSEVLQLIQSQNTISLKVRSVGMIPTKERDKGVTWKFVESSKSNSNGNERFPVLPVRLEVPAHGRLGCGICKGPAWKPGIFVQFTKEACVAKDAGLKRGDQILACNGVKFSPDVTFESAVAVMKSSHVLELLVHRGVGLDLFPGGSSGYNSSTSSLNGESQDDPTLVQFKRLSIVKEESVGRAGSTEDVTMVRAEPRTLNGGSVSLSNAISEEIKRRSERSTTERPNKEFVKVEKSKTEEDTSYHLKLQTLMKEVKEAHNKMFPANHEDSPPSCPTPDYDTMSMTSQNINANNNPPPQSVLPHNTPSQSAKSHNAPSHNSPSHVSSSPHCNSSGGGGKVDMASFKSFTTVPVSTKPPANYFPPPSGFQDEPQSNVAKPPPPKNTTVKGSNPQTKPAATSQSSAKPASPPVMTIREYPTPSDVKVPSKFKFLSNKPACVRFGDELSQTVSQVLVEPQPGCRKNSNVVTISIQHPAASSSPFYLHANKSKGPAPQPPTKNKVTFNF